MPKKAESNLKNRQNHHASRKKPRQIHKMRPQPSQMQVPKSRRLPRPQRPMPKTSPRNSPRPEKDAADPSAALSKAIADRKRIETENQRKLDEYEATLKKGRENVKDLNLRFGDWYFVVDNDVFTKIRLGRDQVIKKKDKKDEAADGKKNDESALGLPGSMIPGLPGLPGNGGK